MKQKYLKLLGPLLVIFPISVLGLQQITFPTYAQLNDTSQVQSTLSAAFVFPNTVDEIAGKAEKSWTDAEGFRQQAQDALTRCLQSESLPEAANYMDKIKVAVDLAAAASQEAKSTAALLDPYFTQALNNSVTAQGRVDSLVALNDKSPPDILNQETENLKRINELLSIIQAAHHRAFQAATSAAQVAQEASKYITQAQSAIDALKQGQPGVATSQSGS